MFDITNYNVLVLFFLLFFYTSLLYIIFRNNFSSLIDPLFIHLVWISSHLSLLTYLILYNFSKFYTFHFMILSFFYLSFLKFFLKPIKVFKDRNYLERVYYCNRNLLFFLFVLVSVVMYVGIFPKVYNLIYIGDGFTYRFVDLQGRNPLFRILAISSFPFFMYFGLIHFIFLKKNRCLFLFLLLIYIFINFLTGNRSILLSTFIIFGYFIFFHYHLLSRIFIQKIQVYSPFFLIISLLVLVIVTSGFLNVNLFTGIHVIINRIFASADGLEYFLKYDAYLTLDSGFIPYFYSIFAVYIKQFTLLEYKNIGWQLAEIASSIPLNFSQGPNYTLFLQSEILGTWISPLYMFILAYVIARLRQGFSFNILHAPIFFYFGFISLNIAVDIEYAFLSLLSGVLFFIVVIIPFVYVYKLLQKS